MASPQLENGYTKIANELLEAFARSHLSGQEWQIVVTLLRKLYGFNKKEDYIATSQICLSTGMNKWRVSENIRALVQKGIVTRKRNGLVVLVGINKDYSIWKQLRKSVKLRENATGVTRKRYVKLRENVDTKETIQNKLIQKKLYTRKSADSFSDSDKVRYVQLCDLLDQVGLQNSVNPKLYLSTIDEYSAKFITWPEVKDCAYWTKDRGLKVLSAPRIRNWFKHKKQWDKDKQNKEISREKDKQGKDPYKRQDYKPPVDMDLTLEEYV